MGPKHQQKYPFYLQEGGCSLHCFFLILCILSKGSPTGKFIPSATDFELWCSFWFEKGFKQWKRSVCLKTVYLARCLYRRRPYFQNKYIPHSGLFLWSAPSGLEKLHLELIKERLSSVSFLLCTWPSILSVAGGTIRHLSPLFLTSCEELGWRMNLFILYTSPVYWVAQHLIHVNEINTFLPCSVISPFHSWGTARLSDLPRDTEEVCSRAENCSPVSPPQGSPSHHHATYLQDHTSPWVDWEKLHI